MHCKKILNGDLFVVSIFPKEFALLSDHAFASFVIASVIVWIAQLWYTNRVKSGFEIKLEESKSSASEKIERLKSELQIKYVEHQVKYAGLYQKMGETVAETYTLLYDLAYAVEKYISPVRLGSDPSREEQCTAVMDMLKNFNNYFRRKRFYLPKRIAVQIEDAETVAGDAARAFMNQLGPGHPHQEAAVWQGIVTDYRLKMVPRLEKLEDEFRTLFGVQDAKPNDNGVSN